MEMNNNYGSGYPSYYQQQNQSTPTQGSSATPNGNKKKKTGAFKKIVIGATTGLLFGVFAGLGFQAVTLTTQTIKDILPGEKKVAESSVDENQEGIIDKIADVIENATEVPQEDVDESANIPDINEAAVLAPTEDVVRATVTDVTKVVEEVMPAVVAVNNKFINKMNYFGQIYSQEAQSAGSGIVVGKNDNELLLVTNYHVIEDAEELTVTFSNEKQAPAQVKGTEPLKDLAVIAIQLSDIDSETMSSLVIAKLGDSDSLTVGEPVVAIGNALGYGQSVTAGVVSALNRPIGAPGEKGTVSEDTFIQTDAAINPGNSGGALLNMYGEVIGINSNKIGGSAVEGMGYAIPISDAKPIIENLMSEQTKLKVDEASQGYLGITGVNVEKQYSEIYGMPVGVYVSSVSDGSGAAAAGLVRGDIIVALNGDKIETMEDLKGELEYYTAGTTVELTIMQGSPNGYQSKIVEVTLGARQS